MSDLIQIWVRTQKGVVFGPLVPTTVELLIDNGAIEGPIQLARDGKTYVDPGQLPGLRMVIPRDLWGQAAPEHPDDKLWDRVVLPPALAQAGGPPAARASAMPPTGGVAAGPGAVTAGPGAAPSAQRPRSAPSAVRPNPTAPARTVTGEMRSPGAAAPRTPTGEIPKPPVSGPPAAAKAPTQEVARPATATRPPTAEVPKPQVPPPAPPASDAAPTAPPPAPVAAAPAPVPVPPAPSAPAAAVALSPFPRSGQLGPSGGLRLYFLAASREVNGLLSLTLPDRVLSVHFRKGAPDFVESSHPEDALSAALLKNALVDAAGLQKAEAEKARFGGELVAALFGLGLLNPNTALNHLMQRSYLMVRQLLLATQGSFTFEAKDLPPAKAFPLGNKWQVYSEICRKMAPEDVRRRLLEVMDAPVMRGNGPVAPADLRLNPQETRTLSFFDGVRSLNQMAYQQPQDADVAFRTAWMLGPCELVSFQGIERRDVFDAAPVPIAPKEPPMSAQKPPENPAVPPQAPRPAAPPAARTQSMPPAAPVPPGAPAPYASSPSRIQQVGGAPSSSSPRIQQVGGAPPGASAPAGYASSPSRIQQIPAPGAPAASAPAGYASSPSRIQPVGGAPASSSPRIQSVGAPPGASAPVAGYASSPSRVQQIPTAPAAAAPFASSPSRIQQVGAAPASSGTPSPVTAGTPKPATAPTGTPAATKTESPAEELKKILALRDTMLKQTHFEVLGITKEADAAAVKSAYFKLARTYHPDTIPADAAPELAKAKQDIFSRVSEAQRTLSDAKLKADYILELESGGEKVDMEKILKGEECFRKGQINLRGRKYPEALKLFTEAMECSPDEPEFWAWKGYATFLTIADKKAGKAASIKDIDRCIQKNPKIAAAYYFRGFILKAVGEVEAAKRDFKKCADLDPSHVDAAREVRMMK